MNVVLAIDADGGDRAPECVVSGAETVRKRRGNVRYEMFGQADKLNGLLRDLPALAAVTQVHNAADAVAPDEKPTRALRRGEATGMWQTVACVRDGTAAAAVSGGNTGALMAIARTVLGTPDIIDRPAIAALWPTLTGECVVLDLGANLEADSERLYQFAVMGAQFAKAVTGRSKVRVGLLNVGTEEVKGNDHVKAASLRLKQANLRDIDYIGFVEGSAIGQGVADVVVTDGFTGNVALKTAEGTASLVGSFLKSAFQSSLSAKAGAWLARGALRSFKEAVDPRRVNGGVFLGLNGLVVKSHGGSDARGFAAALDLAYDLAAAQTQTAVFDALNLALQPVEA